jgi:hypothetical protein
MKNVIALLEDWLDGDVKAEWTKIGKSETDALYDFASWMDAEQSEHVCPSCMGEGYWREGNMIGKKRCKRCLGTGKVKKLGTK